MMPFLFHIPGKASGNCLGAAMAYEKGLRQAGLRYQEVMVVEYRGSLSHANTDTARGIKGRRKYIWHRLTRVGERYVDWSARQFDSRTPYPLVMGLAELQSLWRRVEVTCVPSRAGRTD